METNNLCQQKISPEQSPRLGEKMPNISGDITPIILPPSGNENEITLGHDEPRKICSKCGNSKPISQFYKDRDRRRSDCSTCNSSSRSKYQRQHIPQVLEKNRKWRQNNSDHYSEWLANYAPRRRKNVYTRYHTDEGLRSKVIAESYAYRHDPKNKEKIRATKLRLTLKYRQNPEWRLVRNLRRRLNFVLDGKRKCEATMKLVGCTPFQLMKHLETMFQDGMAWDNYGRAGWHVDHRVPCDFFDLSNTEEQKRCFHYSNLQPLWAGDNLLKGSKISV